MTAKPLMERALLNQAGRSARARDGEERLFDEVALQHRLVARWLSDVGVPLSGARPPHSAGVYGLRYFGSSHPDYCGLDRHRFVYVGKGTNLRERFSSHTASLTDALDLDVGDFTIVAIALESVMHAEVAEHLFIGAFDPLWCRAGWRGFGSRPQGAGRRRQRATDWDGHHPGRLSRTQVRNTGSR